VPSGPRRTVAGLRSVLLAALLLAVAPGPAPAEPRPLAVDPARSSLVAVTDLRGLLSFLGHRHAILAHEWTATLAYDPAEPARSSVDLRVPVHALRIDTPAALERAGLRAAPDAETVRQLQAKMLGEDMLDAFGHPEIRFASTAVEPGPDGALLVRGQLALRGRAREVAVPLRVEPLGAGAYRFRGELEVRQTEYGITPESVAGVVRVADPVAIRIDVVAQERRPAP
jgi:polyisoprenoid-binding protein YceI